MKKQLKKFGKDDSDYYIYKHHYDESTDLYRTINYDGEILACNKSYAKTLGYSINEVLGKTIFDHTADQSLSAMKDTFETWRKTGTVLNHEIWMQKKDGTEFPVLISASNLYDEHEKLIGSNTVIRDISEIFEAKREIEYHKRRKLEMLGELSARIAHDLRNPLTIIKGAITLLETQFGNTDEITSKRLKMINSAVARMSHQIEEVLDFVSPKPLNLEKSSVLKIICSTIDKINVPSDVEIILSKNDSCLKCDGEKLEIVFINLFTNAIQAMNRKGKIYADIQKNETSTIIKIRDTGPGIPQELISKIFDPLFTTRQIGTGLGLPSCKAIVEKHGGTIDVSTTLNIGTTFRIVLKNNL